MAWGWVQSWAAQSIGASTAAAAPAANLTAGSTMIAVVSLSAVTSITCSSVKDAANNSFVAIVSSGYHNQTETSLWALNTPAGDAGAKPIITATTSAGDVATDIVVVEFTGIAIGGTLAALVDGTPKSTFGSSNTATGNSSYSSTASNELLVMGIGDDGGPLTWTLTLNSGTNDNNGGTAKGFNGNSNSNCELAFKNSTNGAETDSWGQSGTATGWGIVCAAFKLAAGGGAAADTSSSVTLGPPARYLPPIGPPPLTARLVGLPPPIDWGEAAANPAAVAVPVLAATSQLPAPAVAANVTIAVPALAATAQLPAPAVAATVAAAQSALAATSQLPAPGIQTGTITNANVSVGAVGAVVSTGAYASTVRGFGPLAYYRLDEASGTTASDSSGNGRNATYTGSGVTYSTASLLASDPADKAVTFDGASGGATYSGTSVTDVFTIECWVKLSGTAAGTQTLVNLGSGSGWLALIANNQVTLDIFNTARIADSGSTLLTAGGTYHVVWTKNGAANHLYVNAVDVTTGLVNATCVAATEIQIGTDGTDFCPGIMDEVAVYGFALTPSQVTTNYTNGGAGGPSPAVVGQQRGSVAVSALAATAQLPAPTITVGGGVTNASVNPAAVAATTQLAVPAVVTQVAISAAPLAATAGLPAPSVVAQQPVSVAVPALAVTAQLPPPSIVAGAVGSVTVTAVAVAVTVILPVATASTAISTTALAVTAQLPAPAIAAGGVTNASVSVGALAATTVLPAPTATTATATAQSALAATTQLPAPLVTLAATLPLAAVTVTTQLPAPAVAATVSLGVAALAATTQLPAPTIQTGAISNASVNPAAVAATSQLPAPAIAAAQVAAQSALAATTLLPATAVAASTTVAVPVLAVTTHLPAPQTGAITNANVSVGAVAATAQSPAPTVAATVTLSPLAVAATSNLPAAATGASAVTATAALAVTGHLPAPTIAAGAANSVSVAVGAVAVTVQLPVPAIKAAAVVAPNPVAATATLPNPALAVIGSIAVAIAVVNLTAQLPAPAVYGVSGGWGRLVSNVQPSATLTSNVQPSATLTSGVT